MSTREEIYAGVQAAVAPILEAHPYTLTVGTELPWTYQVRLTWREGERRLGLVRRITVETLVRAPDYHELLRCWAQGIGLAVEEQLRMAAVAGNDFEEAPDG